MCPYQLSSQARVCVTQHGTVFLDVTHGSYLGIDPHQSRALAGLVADWPSAGATGEAPQESARDLIEVLSERGLLISASGEQAIHATTTLPPPRAELIAWDEMRCPPIRPSHVIAFLRSLLIGLIMLRCRTFAASVARYEERAAARTFDLSEASRLVSTYQYLRTWVFARRGRCLLDSLVLLEFLATFGIHPRWVIGVQVRPFAAHAWLQHEDLLLNATPAFVRPYSPILIV